MEINNNRKNHYKPYNKKFSNINLKYNKRKPH